MSGFPPDWPEIAWDKLPVEIRQRAVERLKLAYRSSFFEQIRQLVETEGLGHWLPPFWHHMQGMHVRNVLRSDECLREMIPVRKAPLKWLKHTVKIGTPEIPPPIKDSELPKLPEIYGENVSTWDDFYIQCIEAAAGLREIDADPA